MLTTKLLVQIQFSITDEILSKINIDMEVTLDDFKITFDINCVTMATDEAEEPKRTYMRMLSNTSTGSSPPESPREGLLHVDTTSSADFGYVLGIQGNSLSRFHVVYYILLVLSLQIGQC